MKLKKVTPKTLMFVLSFQLFALLVLFAFCVTMFAIAPLFQYWLIQLLFVVDVIGIFFAMRALQKAIQYIRRTSQEEKG